LKVYTNYCVINLAKKAHGEFTAGNKGAPAKYEITIYVIIYDIEFLIIV